MSTLTWREPEIMPAGRIVHTDSTLGNYTIVEYPANSIDEEAGWVELFDNGLEESLGDFASVEAAKQNAQLDYEHGFVLSR